METTADTALLSAGTVAERLRSTDTWAATLDAIEAQHGPIETQTALAAAPALGELFAADVERVTFDRVGLLLARLANEAAVGSSAAQSAEVLNCLFNAAFGDGRLEAYCNSEVNVTAEALRRPVEQLTHADARSWACFYASWGPIFARGAGGPALAAFPSSTAFLTTWMREEPL